VGSLQCRAFVALALLSGSFRFLGANPTCLGFQRCFASGLLGSMSLALRSQSFGGLAFGLRTPLSLDFSALLLRLVAQQCCSGLVFEGDLSRASELGDRLAWPLRGRQQSLSEVMPTGLADDTGTSAALQITEVARKGQAVRDAAHLGAATCLQAPKLEQALR